MSKQDFPKPSITGDVIVFCEADKEVLLIKRKKDPFGGCWAIVGGFFNPEDRHGEKRDASVKDAAIRELKEETNIDLAKLQRHEYVFRFLTVQDAPDRDPRGRVVTLIYVLDYWGDKKNLNVKAMDDAEEFRWFKLSYIMRGYTDGGEVVELAFDHLDSIRKFATRDRYE